MNVDQALSVVAQAASQARITWQEHQLTQEALAVLGEFIKLHKDNEQEG